jgi:hypothetical protein
MNNDLLFEEIQASVKKSTRDFFKITSGIIAIALVFNLVLQRGTVTQVTAGLLTLLVIGLLATIFSNMKMVTQIRKDAIYVRFPPFQPSFICYPLSTVSRLQVRKYDAVLEYGGWGVKYRPSGRAFLVPGEMAIEMEFMDNTRVLISTQKPEEVSTILEHIL